MRIGIDSSPIPIPWVIEKLHRKPRRTSACVRRDKGEGRVHEKSSGCARARPARYSRPVGEDPCQLLQTRDHDGAGGMTRGPCRPWLFRAHFSRPVCFALAYVVVCTGQWLRNCVPSIILYRNAAFSQIISFTSLSSLATWTWVISGSRNKRELQVKRSGSGGKAPLAIAMSN